MGDSNRVAAPEACRWCDGSGYDRAQTDTECHVCDGDGTVLVVQPTETCESCYGTGTDRDPIRNPYREADYPCIACRGSGWARVRTET